MRELDRLRHCIAVSGGLGHLCFVIFLPIFEPLDGSLVVCVVGLNEGIIDTREANQRNERKRNDEATIVNKLKEADTTISTYL